MNLKSLNVLAVGLIFGFALSFAACGGKGKCSPASCSGCCSSTGVCQTGNVPTACGVSGISCASCAAGQACNAGLCGFGGTGGGSGGGTAGGAARGRAGGSGGGSGVGGGTGTGGGTVGCTTIATINTDLGGAYYDDSMNPGYSGLDAYLTGPTSTQTNIADVLVIEQYYMTSAFPTTVPRTHTLGATTYADCTECIIYSDGCDASGRNCTTDYLAQGGTLNVTAATLDADAGVYTGTASNLHLVEWDFNNDQAAATNKCVNVTSVTFNATWP